MDSKVCVKCGGEKIVERLDQVGVLWKENSQQVHPLQTLINYVKQSNVTPLAETLILNRENKMATFTYNSCRTEQRNLY